jgi:signal transduction histidine kinase
MTSIKLHPPVLQAERKARPLANLWGKVRPVLPRGLQTELILPYVLLTLILASVGVFIITQLVVGSSLERFQNNMLDASRVANDGFVRQERVQLEKLRFLIFTQGMAQAMYENDKTQVREFMEPVFVNAPIDLMTAVGTDGHDILTYGRDYNTQTYHEQEGVFFASIPVVQKVLDGETDAMGDKFTQIAVLEQGPILFTSGAVIDSGGNSAGAMMVGTYLDHLLVDLKRQALADIVLVDPSGELIATTLAGKEEGFEELLRLAVIPRLDDRTQPVDVKLDRRDYQVAYNPLIIREQPVGWIGVVKNSDYLVNQAATSRNLFILLFTAGTLATILIGYLLSQNISRPLLRLRDLSQAVASGDLNQSIGLVRNDEIGELGEAFDSMTQQLRERTEEAERLYAESLQRNRELKEINERLKATQLQLIQSEKLASIGQLTAGIVHDVKNPFAVIMGMAEVLGEDETLDPELKHGLKVMRESAIKGNTIVSDLLKFARQSQPELHQADLRETVRASLRLTAYLTRRFEMTSILPEKPLLVIYDPQQIEQVLINLIHNAVQAMPEKGKLHVALEEVGETARISVQDSGSGIAPEHLKRIFDPFFTTKAEGEGTGLGLSVSYGIIANHQGRIEVESALGKGTQFTIVLPISQPTTISEEENI